MSIEIESKKFIIQLKTCRIENSLSQLDMATKLNMSHRNYQRMEAGNVYPDLSNLVVLANFQGCELSDLFSYKDDSFNFINKHYIRNLDGGNNFLEVVESFEELVLCCSGDSNRFLQNLTDCDFFLDSENQLLCSNFLKTIKNLRFGKTLQNSAGVVKTVAVSMRDSKRLISIYNHTCNERQKKFSTFSLQYIINQDVVEFDIICYSTFLENGDQIVLGWATLSKKIN